MQHWLVKTEPGTYSWDDLVKEGDALWDGVRNYQARNNLQAMRKEDRVLVYHSGKAPAAVGVARVVREHYQDPTTDDDRWVAVDLRAEFPLDRPVPLARIKATEALAEMVLVRNSRLSVQPVTEAEFERIVEMGKEAGHG